MNDSESNRTSTSKNLGSLTMPKTEHSNFERRNCVLMVQMFNNCNVVEVKHVSTSLSFRISVPNRFCSCLFHTGGESALVDKGQIKFFRRITLTLLLDPTSGGLEGTFANIVHDRAWNGSLEFDIAGIKHTCAVGLGRVGLHVPMARNVVKVASFVVVKSPGHTVLFGTILMVVKRGELFIESKVAELS